MRRGAIACWPGAAPSRAPGLRVLVDQHRERVSILPLEVTDAGALAAAVQQTHQEVEGLDILINNAAINPSDATIPGPDGQQLLDEARALEVFRLNVVAPVRVAQAFTALRAARPPASSTSPRGRARSPGPRHRPVPPLRWIGDAVVGDSVPALTPMGRIARAGGRPS